MKTAPLNKFIDPTVAIGDIIVTANNRQRFMIRETHRLANMPYPNVVSWDMLIKNTWEACSHVLAPENSRRVLSKLEQRELWESVIEAWDEEQEDLLRIVNTDAVAKLASQAYDNSILYGVDITLEEGCDTLELQMMEVWVESISTRLSNLGAIFASQQQALVCKWLCDDAVAPMPVTFYGFSYPNQLQKNVFEHLESKQMCNIVSLNPIKNESIENKAFNTRDDEITACAQWARAKIQEDKTMQIGILIPNLVNYQADILRIFDNTLIPSSMYTPLENHQRPYRISLGTPISERPLIKTLLKLIFMKPGKSIAFEEVSALLRNPFIGGNSFEFIRRAKLEARFRKEGSPTMTWNYIDNMVNLESVNGEEAVFWCPDFASRWNNFTDHYEIWKKGAQSMQDIVNFVKQTYQIWGLSERTQLNVTDAEIEKMLFDETKGWLVEFSKITTEDESLTLMKGLNKLQKLLRDVSFQPASGNSTITILSEYEASHLPFDAIWVMGMTDECWPKSPAPSPFLSKERQIEQNVPHASFQQEHDYALNMTNEMLSQARDITFSYPKTEDSRDCAPSNIIKGLDSNIIGLELEDPYLNYSNEMSSLSEKEFIVEQFAPALTEGQTTQGGTAILRDQAHCPFKGFVNNRLNVKALAVQEVGLSASMRGDLLHSCLDKFWRQVKNHKNLCELIELGTLEKKVSSVIHASIKYFRDRYPDVFTDAIVQLEHDRLVPNITTWMTTFEEPRSPFEKVITEQTRIFSVNGLELTVKVDHTDITISEGGTPKVNIADNKSGNVTPNDWFDKARLMEPQVPLYAIIEQDFGQSIGSVVFKSFKRGKMGNKGIAESQGQAIKVKPIGEIGINTAVDTWRVQIDELAGEYRSGEASVKPHNVVKSCTYCENKSICRIAEKDENAELKTDEQNNTANKESRVIDTDKVTETATTSA